MIRTALGLLPVKRIDRTLATADSHVNMPSLHRVGRGRRCWFHTNREAEMLDLPLFALYKRALAVSLVRVAPMSR
jgi:hypothetical protein